MASTDSVFWIAVLVATTVLFRKEIARAVNELIDLLNDEFRGGPPTGMHPSPANDGAVLLRRRKKVESEHFRR